jgi:type III restriction enzyme
LEPPFIIETKGFDSLEDVKKAAAECWVKAVNADGKFGHWQYSIVRKPEKIIGELNKALANIR